ncbi:MAG: hypothetical protein OEV37_01540 [Candidatus Berkelbacteria bacterium]|nr:hypothetical protein [Candidatus Berkelbacteria bacterium]
MTYSLLSLWLLAIIIYIRASLLATGTWTKKLFKQEGFLLWQKLSAVILTLSAIYALLAGVKFLAIPFAINLIFNFLFYLQPTPRTTKLLLKLFTISNLILLIIYFLG